MSAVSSSLYSALRRPLLRKRHFALDLMLRRRTTIHENRVQQCRRICGGQSVIQAFVSSNCLQVGFILRTKIPRSRLTRIGLRYHHWSYPETGRTRSSAVPDLRCSNRLGIGGVMQTMVERGCGLDVHQATVVACLLIVRKDRRVQKQMRTLGTTTRDLVNLREWLLSEGCTHLAMESTGLYSASFTSVLRPGTFFTCSGVQGAGRCYGINSTNQREWTWPGPQLT